MPVNIIAPMETKFTVRSFDAQIPLEVFKQRPRRPIYVVLDNLRSAFNVGGIFRTADCAGVQKVIPCGITAYPPHRKLDKTALGTADYVPWEHYESALQAVRELKAQGIRIIALETTDISVPYHKMEFPSPVCLVLGNEALGVSQDVLEAADRIVEIPVVGFKNSLNVGIAFGIVVYEIVRQHELRSHS